MKYFFLIPATLFLFASCDFQEQLAKLRVKGAPTELAQKDPAKAKEPVLAFKPLFSKDNTVTIISRDGSVKKLNEDLFEKGIEKRIHREKAREKLTLRNGS